MFSFDMCVFKPIITHRREVITHGKEKSAQEGGKEKGS